MASAEDDFVEVRPRRGRGLVASLMAAEPPAGSPGGRGDSPRWGARKGGAPARPERRAPASPAPPPAAAPAPPPPEYWAQIEKVAADWRARFEDAVLGDENLLHRAFRLWATSDERLGEGRVGGRRGHREKEEFMASGILTSAEQFCREFKALPGAEDLDHLLVEAKLFLFGAEVLSPDWDDPVNLAGGRWTGVIGINHKNEPDLPPYPVWEELCYGLVGGADAACREHVTGVVLVRKTPYVRMAVWVRDGHDRAAVDAVGAWIRSVFPPSLELLFQLHRNANPRDFLYRLGPVGE